MSIKITVLKSGDHLISDMKELIAEDKDEIKAYLLENPHTYELKEQQFLTEAEKVIGDYGINVTLLPWIILSKDKKMMIPVDSVLTVVERVDALTKLYQDKMDSFKMEETDD